MTTEHLTPEEIIEKKYLLQRLCQNTKWRLRDAMEEYAAQQVEQQTKHLKELNETLVSANTEANMKIDQLREERVGLMKDINTAFELLNHVHTFYTLADPLEKEVSNFLTQLNQNNEG